jgi:hypothetical protein
VGGATVAVVLSTTGCGGPAPLAGIDDATLAERFRELHRSVYEVYSLPPDRDALHALLGRAFAGEALTDEYVEHFTTRVRMAREATAIDILRVDYEEVEVLARDRSEIELRADWSVGGIVTHQQHKHPRVNRYRAVFRLGAVEPDASRVELGDLRIVETRLQQLERVRTAFEGTGGFPLDQLPTSGRGLLTARDLFEAEVLDESELAAEEPASEPGREGEVPP